MYSACGSKMKLGCTCCTFRAFEQKDCDVLLENLQHALLFLLCHDQLILGFKYT